MNMDPCHLGRRAMLKVTALAVIGSIFTPVRAEALPAITVWKDPNCGCCGGWVEHLRRNGIAATVIDTADMQAIKAERRVPPELASCHTAEFAGYTIEGHVPAAAILKLLAERPPGRGLAVPGMPVGSPGMEGGQPEAYDVMLFGSAGPTRFGRFLGDKQI